MFISFEWLRELTETRLSLQELRERLTMVGLAIDAVEQHDGDAVLDVEVPSNRPDCGSRCRRLALPTAKFSSEPRWRVHCRTTTLGSRGTK